MGNNSPFSLIKNVPIVGESVGIHAVRPTVVIQCNCGKHGSVPLLIGDWLDVVKCTGCGAHYGLRHFSFDRETSDVIVKVTRLTPVRVDGKGSTLATCANCGCAAMEHPVSNAPIPEGERCSCKHCPGYTPGGRTGTS